MLPMIPMIIISLGGMAVLRGKESKKAELTPERAVIFQTAMNTPLEPEKLRKLSAIFAGEGLTTQAVILEKRAKLREMSKEQKKQRTAIYKKAMKSKNREAIFEVAALFEKDGAIGAAEAMRTYAMGLS